MKNKVLELTRNVEEAEKAIEYLKRINDNGYYDKPIQDIEDDLKGWETEKAKALREESFVGYIVVFIERQDEIWLSNANVKKETEFEKDALRLTFGCTSNLLANYYIEKFQNKYSKELKSGKMEIKQNKEQLIIYINEEGLYKQG